MKTTERKFAVRVIHDPHGKPVAAFPFREWRQADLLAARLTSQNPNRAEFGSHFVVVVKVPEGQFARTMGA